MPTTEANAMQALTEQLQAIREALERAYPAKAFEVDWNASLAFRWRRREGRAQLEPVKHIADIAADQLKNIDRQVSTLLQNTRQLVAGLPANNVLLTGARGTGKSSLVRAMLHAYASQGLRLIEVEKEDLVDLQDIVDLVADRPEKFIIFCDDLSFEEGEPGYKALKSALDGSIAAAADNVLIYATSNRRHLMPEYMADNLNHQASDNGEIHPAETVEEKVSLSERFGLWVSFHTFNQDEYLAAVTQWMKHYGATDDQVQQARPIALRFTLERGARSGRVAYQFARHWMGQYQLEQSNHLSA